MRIPLFCTLWVVAAAAANPPAAPPATLPATRPTFAQVLGQSAYEGALLNSLPDFASLKLTPDQAQRADNALHTFEQDRAAFQLRHKDDLEIIQKDIAETMQQVALSGGQADPEVLMRQLQRHEAFFREVLEMQQKYRRSLTGILVLDQNAQWHAVIVRQQLDRRLEPVQLTAEQRGRVDRISRDLGTEAAQLPEPREMEPIQDLVRKGWKRCHQEVLTPEQRERVEPASIEEALQRGR